MVDDGAPPFEHDVSEDTAGQRLRQARVSRKLDLADIAARTRIPQRHLEAIEAGNYAALPAPTYATGFAKAYARVVELDEVAIGRQVREALHGGYEPRAAAPAASSYSSSYNLPDPTRTPSRGLVWLGLLVAVLIVAGVGLYYGTNLFRGLSVPTLASDPAGEAPPAAAPAPPTPVAAAQSTSGQVTLIANDEVWVRIYDAADTTLLMKTLKAGERYDVPASANGPMINIGRPDKLSITVNGSAVAPLGDGKRAIKDVPISAAALLARGQAPAAAVPAATTHAASPERSQSAPPPAFRRQAGAAPERTAPAPAAPPSPTTGDAAPAGNGT